MDAPHPLPLPKRICWPYNDAGNDIVLFQRSFTVDTDAVGVLYLSASGSFYDATLDGELLPLPRTETPSWIAMRRVTVPLARGGHTLMLAADASLGEQHSYILASLDWYENGQLVRLPTDDSWEVYIEDGAEGSSRSISSLEGEYEPPHGRPIDLRGSKPRVLSGDLPRAWAIDGVWAEPWGMPANAPDDWCRLTTGWQEVTDETLSRIADVRQGMTLGGASATVNGDGSLVLAPPRPFPASPPDLRNHQPRDLWHRTRQEVNEKVNTWLELFEARCPNVVLDAGAETFGRVKVRLRSGGPATIAVTTGESLPEVDRYARRYTDVFTLEDGEEYATSPHGFRYVKVMALGAGSDDAPMILEPVTVQHIRYPVERVGSFRCSDATLDKIWELSAHTVHLCMQNEIWDGIKRDQLPWMGDLYTENLAVYHAFGDTRLARRSLAVLGEIGPAPAPPLAEQRYPGLVASWKGPDGGDINTIPSYTLWWVVGLHDYVQYTGDTSLIAELADTLVATLDHVAAWVGDDGLWRHRAGWDFVDWSPLTDDDRAAFCHLLATHALWLGSLLLVGIGRDGMPYRETASRMTEAARREWWQDGVGSFGTSHHANAMAIRSGVLRNDEIDTVFARTLAPDPPQTMTYWHRYGDLEAARLADDIVWGLAYIRRHWGRAVQLGHTALWEAWDDAWLGPDPHAVSMIADAHAQYGGYRTSLCHGWSAGPAVWLHTAVLGVAPDSPGFAQVHFAPDLGDLAWAEGTIPTPHGPITVRLDAAYNGDRAPATVTAPAGVEVHVPDEVRERWAVEIRKG